jgi:DNA primase
MGIIDEVKQKADIVEIIGQYVTLTKSGRTMRAPCPFHSEKKPSFFVYPEQQSWHCFGACNTGGDVFSFIMKKEGLDFADTLRLLAEKTGVVIPSHARSEAEEQTRDKIYEINQSAAQYYHNLLLKNSAAEKARNYLKSRGLNEKVFTDFQLGYSLPAWESLKLYMLEKGFQEAELLDAGLLIKTEASGKTHDRFRDHIMFPIMDERGRTTGFGARVLDDSSPKYINSPQTRIFDKSGSLYGIHLARTAIRQQDLAVLVEGYMDVIVAHQYGCANVVAPMGVAINDKQINYIKKITRNVSLALDPDTAGEDAAMRCVIFENTLDADIKVITLPAGQDPDEVIKADLKVWQQQVEKALPVIDFTIKVIAAKLDMKSSHGKTELVNKILPIIADVKAGPRQYRYLTSLSLATGIEDRKLEAALASYKTDRKVKAPRPAAMIKATRTLSSNPVEEYILTIMLKHPEMKAKFEGVSGDYFENSENRAVFEICQSATGPAATESLDPVIREHLDLLLQREVHGEDLEARVTDCGLRLRERYLRSLKRRQEAALSLEAEAGDQAAVLTKIQELGTIIDQELSKIFTIRAKPPKEEKNEKI